MHTVFSCVVSRNRGGAPAPGYRTNVSGELYHVGSNGYGWASSYQESSSYYLAFQYDWLNPNFLSRRAYGIQLRCLQE